MRGFADYATPGGEGYLMLVGPSVKDVSDDPEGAAVYADWLLQWHELSPSARARILLITLPLDDIDENAAPIPGGGLRLRSIGWPAASASRYVQVPGTTWATSCLSPPASHRRWQSQGHGAAEPASRGSAAELPALPAGHDERTRINSTGEQNGGYW
jgi:hypothetical protein